MKSISLWPFKGNSIRANEQFLRKPIATRNGEGLMKPFRLGRSVECSINQYSVAEKKRVTTLLSTSHTRGQQNARTQSNRAWNRFSYKLRAVLFIAKVSGGICIALVAKVSSMLIRSMGTE